LKDYAQLWTASAPETVSGRADVEQVRDAFMARRREPTFRCALRQPAWRRL